MVLKNEDDGRVISTEGMVPKIVNGKSHRLIRKTKNEMGGLRSAVQVLRMRGWRRHLSSYARTLTGL